MRRTRIGRPAVAAPWALAGYVSACATSSGPPSVGAEDSTSRASSASTSTEAGSLAARAGATSAPSGDSKPVDPKYVWDLTDLFASPEAWDAARKDVLETLPAIEAREGALRGASDLAETLELVFDTRKEAARVRVYAYLDYAVDLRDPNAAERRQLAQQMLTELENATSWLEPAISALGAKRVQQYRRRSEALEPYAFYLEDILRRAPHTLDAEAESVIAASSMMQSAPNDIYSVLTTADFEWPEIEIEGETVRMDRSGYSKYREHPDRAIRKKTFEAFFGKLKDFESSLGKVLSAEVDANLFQSRVRNYESVLAWALSDDAIPEAVYRTLVEQTNAALPSLHRYLRLRARMLEIDDLGYHDMYPSLVDSDASWDIEMARKLTLAALQPLGEAYVERLEYATQQRWQHVFPSEGKRGGAFMAGSAYDVHPYIMLNHNETYDALSTYAHEWGHAVHTMLAKEAQPWATVQYSPFVAEVASIANELFLSAYMLENAEDDDERLFFLGQELELIRRTYFRQAMFAEFELAVHEEVAKGNALSGPRLTEMYGDLLRKYHGHEDGVLTIAPPVDMEWAYIPHFYYDFYVFQYATSIAGGALLVRRVLEEGPTARENLLEVFRAGGSDHPYDILKRAGIDLATPAPHRALIARMEAVMDQIEAILDRQAPSARRQTETATTDSAPVR